MGNENERKRDPAENRENEMGHQWDEVKTGGDERNVGLTGDAGFGPGGSGMTGSSAGTGGAIGGSAEFLSGESRQPSGSGSKGGASSADRDIGSETKQVLTGDQEGDDNFGGRTGSGTSAIAANNSRADLGASGAGSPGGQSATGEAAPDRSRGDKPARGQDSERSSDDEPAVGPGGQSEIGGASDLGGGETGLGDGGGTSDSDAEEPSDYLQKDGNPQAGFAERGRGAPDGSQPGGIEGTGERTANRGSDIEGSSL